MSSQVRLLILVCVVVQCFSFSLSHYGNQLCQLNSVTSKFRNGVQKWGTKIVMSMMQDEGKCAPSKALSRRAVILIAAASTIVSKRSDAETESKASSDAYWDNLLKEGRISKKAYQVLHFAATEKPFTSLLLKEKRNGVFTCAA
jgi:hypothetical protein